MTKRREETWRSDFDAPDPFAPSTVFADLPRDALFETLGNLDCGEPLRRAALASRATRLAAEPYDKPCRNAAIADVRASIAARFTAGMLLNVVRRSLTLVTERLPISGQRVDTRAWEELTVIVTVMGSPDGAAAALAHIAVGESLTVAGVTYAGAIADADGDGFQPQALPTAPSYRAWLDALDGGVTPVGVNVARALADVLLNAPTAPVAALLPPWFAAHQLVATHDPTDVDPAAAPWLAELLPPRLAFDDDLRSCCLPLLMFCDYASLEGVDSPPPFWSLRLLNRNDLPRKQLFFIAGAQEPLSRATHIMRVSADVSRSDRLPDTPVGQRTPDWNLAAEHVLVRALPTWLTRLWEQIIAMNGSDPQLTAFNAATLLRAVYADVLPSRVVTWRRALVNRGKTFDEYLDEMEAANGVAGSAWLVSALTGAFSRMALTDGGMRLVHPVRARDALRTARDLDAYRVGDVAHIDRDRRRASPSARYPRRVAGIETLMAGGGGKHVR